MRAYSTRAWPHRILFDTDSDPQRGDDVKVLQRATVARLQARNIDRPVTVDGVFGDKTAGAAKTASHFLGCPDEWHSSKAGLLVREQRVIVYPDKRTESMLTAARARMAKLEKDREKAPAGDGNLTDAEISKARDVAVAAFRLAYNHRGAVHYTQGGSRWQGINERRRVADDRFPTQADCSSLATWALWNALTHVGGMAFPDVVNGQGWQAGYTGTLLMHGALVTGARRPGDLVIYGSRWPGSHVAMVAANTGYVYSHGSESGPHYLAWNYRGDVLAVRRYIR